MVENLCPIKQFVFGLVLLQVVDWQHGEGYFCKDDADVRHTFMDYVENGEHSSHGQFQLDFISSFFTKILSPQKYKYKKRKAAQNTFSQKIALKKLTPKVNFSKIL